MNKKIENLDPLRGFLAICVVLQHIPIISNTVGLPSFSDLSILHRGHQAVVVFFGLSGYLIIGLLYDEKKKSGHISIRNFYIRRVLRLYPVYYFVLFFGLVYYNFLLPFFNIPFDVKYNILEGIAWNVAFMPNVFKVLYEPGGILMVLWSIGIEEQFYLLIAPLLSLTPINKYIRYLLVFTSVYFIVFHTDYFSFLREYQLRYFFMSAGGLIAILTKNGMKLHFKSFFLRLAVYISFLLHFSTDIFLFEIPILKNLFELILFNVFLINLVYDDRIKIKNYFLNYIGRISYGIYMYHMIVINFILFLCLKININNYLQGWTTIILINSACIFGTLLASHVSFKYFESYFIELKGKFRKTTLTKKLKN